MKQALMWNDDNDIGYNNNNYNYLFLLLLLQGIAKSAALKIVVLEGLFKPTDFDDPNFLDEVIMCIIIAIVMLLLLMFLLFLFNFYCFFFNFCYFYKLEKDLADECEKFGQIEKLTGKYYC